MDIDVPILPLANLGDTPLPSYQSPGSAGMDIHAAIDRPRTLEPGAIETIPTGFALATPTGYEAQVRPRSGLATRFGITLPNAPGTIDNDYRGEVMVALINLGRERFTVEPAMRIAQLVVAPIARVAWQRVESLSPTQRGEGGFGHTGR